MATDPPNTRKSVDGGQVAVPIGEWSIEQDFGEVADWDIDWGDGDPAGVVALASLPVERFPGWTATAVLTSHEGQIAIRSIRIDSDGEPERALDSRVLKGLGLHELQRAIAHDLRGPLGRMALPIEWSYSAPRPGRRGRTNLELALWVRRYLEACDAHPGKGAVAALNAEHHVGVKTIQDILRQARTRGLIEGMQRGVQGGAETEKTRRLLDGER